MHIFLFEFLSKYKRLSPIRGAVNKKKKANDGKRKIEKNSVCAFSVLKCYQTIHGKKGCRCLSYICGVESKRVCVCSFVFFKALSIFFFCIVIL